MASNYLQEALDKYPEAVSNYEALTLLENDIHKELMALKNGLDEEGHNKEFIRLRNKYLEIRLLKKEVPVIRTKTA